MRIEILGKCNKETLESRVQNIAAAGKLSRFPGNVIEVLESCNDYESNLKLIKRIIKMGHKSIIEHDYILFALCDVTPIVEQTIIGYRLTSFTIKSRREVDFRNVGYYIPNFRDKNLNPHESNKQLQEEYKNHMKMLFDTYGDIADTGINVEDARFILPYSYHSNIIMGLNARELEKMIVAFRYGPLSKITEIKELGDKLFDVVSTHLPYLKESILDQETVEIKTGFEYLEKNSIRDEIKILDKPKLVSYTENSDDIVLESLIMYHYQCSKEEATKKLDEMIKKDNKAKYKLMKELVSKDEQRELEQVNFTFQLPISLAILTHLTRHRMHSLLIPEFLPMWNLANYVTPESVKNKVNDVYETAVKMNIEMLEKFKEAGVAEEDLVYFYLGNQMLNVVTTMNARNIKWISRLRCCNKAQWQIRHIAKDMVKQVFDVAPIMGANLGPTCITDRFCGEGRECCGLIDALLKKDEEVKDSINIDMM